jgi:hypothetical protein
MMRFKMFHLMLSDVARSDFEMFSSSAIRLHEVI